MGDWEKGKHLGIEYRGKIKNAEPYSKFSFLVSLQKIGCGSAIKVNFIALTLHYFCRK